MLTKRANKLQARKSKDNNGAVMEEEVVTKDLEDKLGASTAQYTFHKLESSRDKYMILEQY